MAQSELFPRAHYVIDTSSFVDIKLESDPAKVWTGIFGLAREGSVFTVAYVFPELERMVQAGKLADEYYRELKTLKSAIVVPDSEIILEAGRINAQNPKLGDWLDPKNRADPWVIAAAKVRECIVVTEEADTGPGKTHKMPWVCDREGVKWMRVSRLAAQEGLLD